MSKDIVRPVTDDDLAGFDSLGQFWIWQLRGDGAMTGSIYDDVREKTCCICGNRWELTAKSLINQHRNHITSEWSHKTCWIGYIAMQEATTFYRALCDARGPAEIAWSWTKIPDGYGGAWGTPWYLVSFDGYVPKVKIGNRKRVTHLSMHDLTRKQVDMFLPLVKQEDVTKGSTSNSVMIHAWSVEKILEYLGHFYAILQADPKLEDQKGGLVFDIK